MPGARHSPATRLAAVFLARQSGIDTAAATFGADPATIRRWLDTVVLPDSEWGAIEKVLLARAGEMTAKGESRQLVATLTAAGISSRNRRYETLIERRDARRSAEADAAKPEPNPILDLVIALPPERKRWLSDMFTRDGYVRHLVPEPEPTEGLTPEAALPFFEWLTNASDEELAQAVEEQGAQGHALVVGYRAFRRRSGYVVVGPDGREQPWGDELTYPYDRIPLIDERPEPPAVDVTPRRQLPTPRLEQAPVVEFHEPGPHVWKRLDW